MKITHFNCCMKNSTILNCCWHCCQEINKKDNKMKSKEFGQYLKELRQAKKIRLTDMKATVGIFGGFYNQLETAYRDIPNLKKVKKIVDSMGGDFNHALDVICESLKKS